MKKVLTTDLIANLKEVAKNKNLDADVILDSLKEALVFTAKKYTGIQKRFEARIDEETGEIRLFLDVEVVEDFPDPPEDATAEEVARMDEHYMLLDEAEDYDENVQVGDQLTLEYDIDAFGRPAIQMAKQILQQKVREAERRRVLAEYSSRIGTLVSAQVTQVERGDLIIDMGSTEAILPQRRLMRRDRYRQGDSVLAIIADVTENGQVLLSRTDSRFLAELFRREVAEVYDGTIEIVGIVREPGERAKVAVRSRDDRVDPVGVVVGPRGSRIQPVVRELNNERIDLIPWTDDLEMNLRRAFSPAEVRRVHEVEGVSRVVVLIKDEDVALSMGKGRRNLKLVSNLLGRHVEVYGEAEFQQFSADEQAEILAPKSDDRPLSEEEVARQSRSRNKFSELNALFHDQAEG